MRFSSSPVSKLVQLTVNPLKTRGFAHSLLSFLMGAETSITVGLSLGSRRARPSKPNTASPKAGGYKKSGQFAHDPAATLHICPHRQHQGSRQTGDYEECWFSEEEHRPVGPSQATDGCGRIGSSGRLSASTCVQRTWLHRSSCSEPVLLRSTSRKAKTGTSCP